MTKIKNSFESKEELKQLNIARLFTLQKLELKELQYYIYEKEDKNLGFKALQNIMVINLVIQKKLYKNGK